MIKSKKPKKQRKFIKTAPIHIRKNFLRGHISKTLKKSLGINKRTITMKKGDKVKVKVGKQKNKEGKILRVDYKKSMIYIEGLTRLNAKGDEKLIPIRPSNVEITELVTDKDRNKILKR